MHDYRAAGFVSDILPSKGYKSFNFNCQLLNLELKA
jgi:hypothetical protein